MTLKWKRLNPNYEPGKINPLDGMMNHPDAQWGCPKCEGGGWLDAGYSTAYVPILCECIKKEKK